jgi:hypothetical protein
MEQSIYSLVLPGLIGGLCNTYVGHPLDTIRVQLQSTNSKGVVNVCKRLVNNGNVLHTLFRGSNLSALGMMAENSVLFAINDILLDYINPDEKSRTFGEEMISGFVSGVSCAIVASPFETLKCNQQVNTNVNTMDHYKMLGNRNMYRGLVSSLVNKSVYYTTFFPCYYHFLDILNEMYDTDSLVVNGVAGGMAGAVSWSVAYPLDVIKCNQQIALTDSDSKFVNTLRRIYGDGRSASIRNFYKGLTVTIIRSFPASFALLYGVEYTNRIVRKFDL